MPSSVGLAVMILQPESAGYSASYSPNDFLRVQLKGGLARYRRDLIGSSMPVTCQWRLTDIEYEYFTTFYRDSILSGSQFFLIDALIDGPQVRRYIAHFVSPWRLTEQSGLTYVVQAELEITSPTGTTYMPSADFSGLVNQASGGLMLWLPFKDGTFNDQSINNNTVTIQGDPAELLSLPITGFQNDYDNDGFLQCNTAGLTGFGSYTKMVWLRRYTTAAGTGMAVFYTQGGLGQQVFGFTSANQIFAGHNGGTLTGGVVANNVTIHMAFSFDEPAQVAKLFMNGAIVATTGSFALNLNPGSGNNLFGLSGGAAGISFRGSAKHAMVFNRVLTDGEVQGYYNAQLADSLSML